jgi:putative oxidoreductase
MLSVLRIVAAAVFIEHGTQKLFNLPPGQMPAHSFVLYSQVGLAGMIETFGGIAILLGVFTRPVAFLLAGEMAVAYFRVHFPKSPLPIQNGGDDAVLFCFLYLYLMVAGAGSWSIDHLIAAAKQPTSLNGLNERTTVRPLRNNVEDRRRDAV